MGADDREAGYGFARGGNPDRKKVGRRTAAPVGPPPSKQPRFPHPPVLAGDRAPLSQKPPWVWLLIGFLLGTGGTLLTSSVWLPESGHRAIAGLETGGGPALDRGERPDDDVAPDVDLVPDADLVKTATDDRTPEEPRRAPTSVAAVTTEEPTRSPPVPRTSSPADEAIGALPDRAESANASDIEATRETPPLRATRDTVTESDQKAALANPLEARRDPSDVLAALVAKSQAERRLAELVDAPDQAQTSRIDPSPRAPAAAAPDAAASPVASNDGAASTAGALPDIRRVEPSNAAEQADLPPRIRQALLAAKAESQTTSKQDTVRGSRLYRVQLAAVDDEAAARNYWREVNRRLPGAFADVEPIYDQRLVDERSYLRIWVGAFDNRIDAVGYCDWLKQQGQDCFVTRVDNL
ncbi:MAG: SPOR domain-containing protein [Alphaproteobacteria bacterium]|nr:SPOR domain-containing protein [Alphaproteobacteria bacterium]